MPKIPPPAYVAAGLLAQHVLAHRGRRPGPVRIAGSVAAAGLGLGLFASAAAAFRQHRTTIDPVHPERASTIVEEGPFGLTRNPMYVGMTAVLSAHAIARGGLLTWLPVAGFVAVIDRVQIPAEEAAMRANFGEAYDGYARRVPRWTPGT